MKMDLNGNDGKMFRILGGDDGWEIGGGCFVTLELIRRGSRVDVNRDSPGRRNDTASVDQHCIVRSMNWVNLDERTPNCRRKGQSSLDL